MAYRPKILIVDDEPRLCDSLKILLANERYEIHTAYSGHQALERLAENGFDLVLLDIVMPDVNGHQVMDYISSRDPDTCVIVITGHATVDSAIESLRRGAYDYLKKPFEFEELLKRVKNALDQKKLKKEYDIVNGKLKLSERRYQYLVNNSPDLIYTLELEGKFTFVGGTVESLLGYKTGELLGKDYTFIVLEDDIDKAKNHYAEIKNGHVSRSVELRLKPPDNSNKANLIVELKSVAMYDNAGGGDDKKFVGIYGVARDISARKRAEDALRESEERLRSLSENAPDIIYTLGLDGSLTYVNPAWERVLGHKREEVIGKYFVGFCRKEEASHCLSLFKLVKEGRETITDASCTLMHKDGSDRIFSMSGAPNLDSQGKVIGIVGLFRDITEQCKLESQLIQARKMEAIGTMAGGIAHDFNNLLMGIQGRISLMFLDIDCDHPHFEHLNGIEDVVKSGASLARQLLGFARGGKYEVKPTDLNDLVERSSEMFGRTRKEIKIHKGYQQGLWAVEVDRGQIGQVLLNLYVNAWHAMPERGALYLKTENVVLREKDVMPFGLMAGNYVNISVTDTGLGMDEDTQKRIFEPFFTTKEMRRGSGLGLASAYGIIKNHGGIINVQSKKDKGSTFNIYLPASERKVEKEEESHGNVLRGTETVLLVDDEDMVIDVSREVLLEMGYKVMLARSGKEAVEVYKKNKDQIDLVILDMIMPDMGGGDAYDRMKVINSDIKVLLSSGYSVNGEASQILARGCDAFIQKPFTIEQLSQSIRRVLDR
ncbi:MAG: response regulator [Desulfobacterales bacterium]|nr:response regulator [Desulfobacterales bacterium]